MATDAGGEEEMDEALARAIALSMSNPDCCSDDEHDDGASAAASGSETKREPESGTAGSGSDGARVAGAATSITQTTSAFSAPPSMADDVASREHSPCVTTLIGMGFDPTVRQRARARVQNITAGRRCGDSGVADYIQPCAPAARSARARLRSRARATWSSQS